MTKLNQDISDDSSSSQMKDCGSVASRSYSSYMDEINKDELLEGLLGYGLFAEKIPPVFTSKFFL